MEFYDDLEEVVYFSCGCDDHCGADSWGCDN